MTDAERKKLFPVHIDLCKTREVPDYSAETASTSAKPSKPKTKKVTDCPTLYIHGIDGLDQLPEDGYILIEIHRSELKVISRSPGERGDMKVSMYGDEEGTKGKTMDAELEVHSICLQADQASSDDSAEGEDPFGDAMDKTAEKMGLKAKSKAPSGDEDDNDEDEE